MKEIRILSSIPIVRFRFLEAFYYLIWSSFNEFAQ